MHIDLLGVSHVESEAVSIDTLLKICIYTDRKFFPSEEAKMMMSATARSRSQQPAYLGGCKPLDATVLISPEVESDVVPSTAERLLANFLTFCRYTGRFECTMCTSSASLLSMKCVGQVYVEDHTIVGCVGVWVHTTPREQPRKYLVPSPKQALPAKFLVQLRDEVELYNDEILLAVEEVVEAKQHTHEAKSMRKSESGKTKKWSAGDPPTSEMLVAVKILLQKAPVDGRLPRTEAASKTVGPAQLLRQCDCFRTWSRRKLGGLLRCCVEAQLLTLIRYPSGTPKEYVITQAGRSTVLGSVLAETTFLLPGQKQGDAPQDVAPQQHSSPVEEVPSVIATRNETLSLADVPVELAQLLNQSELEEMVWLTELEAEYARLAAKWLHGDTRNVRKYAVLQRWLELRKELSEL